MRHLRTVAGALAGLALLAGVVLAVEEFELPSFFPADDQRPAPTPPEGLEVAVFQVALTANDERVTAEVRSQDRVNSYAPKVVARSSGDWEVRVLGEEELVYQIPNPFDEVEVENLDDVTEPFGKVPNEALDWTLIVPLHRDGRPLGATSVEVVDLVSGETILAEEIAR